MGTRAAGNFILRLVIVLMPGLTCQVLMNAPLGRVSNWAARWNDQMIDWVQEAE